MGTGSPIRAALHRVASGNRYSMALGRACHRGTSGDTDRYPSPIQQPSSLAHEGSVICESVVERHIHIQLRARRLGVALGDVDSGTSPGHCTRRKQPANDPHIRRAAKQPAGSSAGSQRPAGSFANPGKHARSAGERAAATKLIVVGRCTRHIRHTVAYVSDPFTDSGICQTRS
jgi:hypothetical protein